MIIRGIAQPENFPDIDCYESRYCQLMINYQFKLPEAKPHIERINTTTVDVCISDYKLIQTPVGFKIIFDGNFLTSIEYTADCSAQSMHSAHDKVNFRNFIDIPLDKYTSDINKKYIGRYKFCKDKIIYGEPRVLIEDLEVEVIEKCTISISAILFVWVDLGDYLYEQDNKNVNGNKTDYSGGINS